MIENTRRALDSSRDRMSKHGYIKVPTVVQYLNGIASMLLILSKGVLEHKTDSDTKLQTLTQDVSNVLTACTSKTTPTDILECQKEFKIDAAQFKTLQEDLKKIFVDILNEKMKAIEAVQKVYKTTLTEIKTSIINHIAMLSEKQKPEPTYTSQIDTALDHFKTLLKKDADQQRVEILKRLTEQETTVQQIIGQLGGIATRFDQIATKLESIELNIKSANTDIQNSVKVLQESHKIAIDDINILYKAHKTANRDRTQEVALLEKKLAAVVQQIQSLVEKSENVISAAQDEFALKVEEIKEGLNVNFQTNNEAITNQISNTDQLITNAQHTQIELGETQKQLSTDIQTNKQAILDVINTHQQQYNTDREQFRAEIFQRYNLIQQIQSNLTANQTAINTAVTELVSSPISVENRQMSERIFNLLPNIEKLNAKLDTQSTDLLSTTGKQFKLYQDLQNWFKEIVKTHTNQQNAQQIQINEIKHTTERQDANFSSVLQSKVQQFDFIFNQLKDEIIKQNTDLKSANFLLKESTKALKLNDLTTVSSNLIAIENAINAQTNQFSEFESTLNGKTNEMNRFIPEIQQMLKNAGKNNERVQLDLDQKLIELEILQNQITEARKNKDQLQIQLETANQRLTKTLYDYSSIQDQKKQGLKDVQQIAQTKRAISEVQPQIMTPKRDIKYFTKQSEYNNNQQVQNDSNPNLPSISNPAGQPAYFYQMQKKLFEEDVDLDGQQTDASTGNKRQNVQGTKIKAKGPRDTNMLQIDEPDEELSRELSVIVNGASGDKIPWETIAGVTVGVLSLVVAAIVVRKIKRSRSSSCSSTD